MRAALLVAALLVLSACGKNDQTDNMQNVDDNLSADSIVSNDVTAIDAVTGDAANMAADVDMVREHIVHHGPQARDPTARIARRDGDAERDVGLELNFRHSV